MVTLFGFILLVSGRLQSPHWHCRGYWQGRVWGEGNPGPGRFCHWVKVMSPGKGCEVLGQQAGPPTHWAWETSLHHATLLALTRGHWLAGGEGSGGLAEAVAGRAACVLWGTGESISLLDLTAFLRPEDFSLFVSEADQPSPPFEWPLTWRRETANSERSEPQVFCCRLGGWGPAPGGSSVSCPVHVQPREPRSPVPTHSWLGGALPCWKRSIVFIGWELKYFLFRVLEATD